jgi:hypothetical protein
MITSWQESQTSSARTSDWIGQLNGGVITAYDPAVLVGGSLETHSITTGKAFEVPSETVGRRHRLPLGEHIREAIRSLRGT